MATSQKVMNGCFEKIRVSVSKDKTVLLPLRTEKLQGRSHSFKAFLTG